MLADIGVADTRVADTWRRCIVLRDIALAIAVAAGAVGCAGPVGVSGSAFDHPCREAIDSALARTGVHVDDLSNVLAQADITGAGVDRTLIGYRFQGRPPACAEGDVAISLWPNCGIQQIRTRGGCKLTGL